MATRIKTVQYHFPVLASLENNTLTNLPQLTGIQITEAIGSSFSVKNAWIEVNFRDIITSTGGTLTTKTFGFRFNSDTYQTLTNTATYGHSAENASFKFNIDYTTYVQSKGSALANASADFQLQIDQSTGTTTGMVDVFATLFITYSYDDEDSTISTLTKSVTIPLEAFRTVLPSSKPASAQNTVPALNSYLPETNKSIKQIVLVLEGCADAPTDTDYILSIQVDSAGSIVTTSNIEKALQTDLYFYYHWVNPATLINDTVNSHDLFYWISTGNVTRFNHLSARIVVTYTYDKSSTNTLLSLEVLDFLYTNVKTSTPTVTKTKIRLPQFSEIKRCGLILYTTMHYNSSTGIYTKILDATSYSSPLAQQGSGVVSGSKVFSEYINIPSLTPNAENELSFYIYDTSANTQAKYISFYGRWILNLVVSNTLTYDNYQAIIKGLGTTEPFAYPITFDNLTYLPDYYYIRHLSILAFVGGAGVHRQFTFHCYKDNGTQEEPLFDILSPYDERVNGVKIYTKSFKENEIWKNYPQYWDDSKLNPKSSYNFYFLQNSEGVSFTSFIVNVIFNGERDRKTITGYLYDNNGNYTDGVAYLFKKSGDKIELLSYQAVSSGIQYSFDVYDDESNYFVVARKEGTPNIFDVTDFTLQGS